APARPGRYLLWWDMVQEEITWFSARGDAGWREPVLVGDVAPAPGPSAAVAKLDDPDVPRRQLWSAARAMFRAHPLLGVGPDNFRHLYGRTLGLPVADDRLHANSLYFETLADLGLGGVLAWGALLVALARAARRALPQPTATGVVVALGTFLLHGALDYFFAFTPTFVMFWLLVGALVALDPQTSEPGREPAA
ncbi:MAG TPA: O-antigen ligase family protein, partial [Polyangia bacterium]|nr:O-antigen ligase family protein [Polyangia bacterium]